MTTNIKTISIDISQEEAGTLVNEIEIALDLANDQDTFFDELTTLWKLLKRLKIDGVIDGVMKELTLAAVKFSID